MKTYKYVIGFLSLLFFAWSPAPKQEPHRVRVPVPQSGEYRLLTEDGVTVIPFEFISNHVVIPVEVNGKTLKLILDTGMPLDGALLFGSEKVNALDFNYIGKAPVMGAGGNMVESDMTMGVTLRIPHAEFTNQMVLVMPQDSIRSKHYEGKDGVIGQTLFSRFVVRIDHDKMEVALTEPDRFEYTGSGQELPLRIDRYPFLACEGVIMGGERIPLELVIDTGNGASLTLNVGAHDGLVLPEKVIEYHTRSVSREILRLMGRIDRLHLGPYVLKDLLSSFRTSDHEPAPPWGKAGALGQGVLRRFNIVFDYKHEKIIFEPNSHFNEPFEFNMAGIQVIRSTQGHFRITRVIPDSPASESDLQVGDHIVQIYGRPSHTFSTDDFEELLRKEGEEVGLDIHRGKRSLHMRVSLRRLI
jgi:hypothetical protein